MIAVLSISLRKNLPQWMLTDLAQFRGDGIDRITPCGAGNVTKVGLGIVDDTEICGQ